MVKNGAINIEHQTKVVKKILITQPKPEGEKSPYFDLARKHNIELHFHPFIVIDGIPAKEFRKQKIEIANYTFVLLNQLHSIFKNLFFTESARFSMEQMAQIKVYLM